MTKLEQGLCSRQRNDQMRGDWQLTAWWKHNGAAEHIKLTKTMLRFVSEAPVTREHGQD